MSYYLTDHPRKYNLSYKDLGLSLITGLSGAPYASRHWQLSRHAEAKHCLGHRLIACIESIPIAGALTAILERIIVFIQGKLLKEGRLPKHKAVSSFSYHASANTFPVLHLAATSSPPQQMSLSKLLDNGQSNLQSKPFREVYICKEPQELQVLIKQSAENIARIYEASKELKKPSTSKQYSLLVSKVEEEVAKIKILDKVLTEKDQVVEGKQIGDQEKVLKQMYKDMPLGENVLLPEDIKRMKNLSRRHKTLDNERLSLARIDILAVVIFRVSETADQISKLETLSPATKEALRWTDTGGSLAATGLSMGVTSYRVYTNREKIFLATKLILRYLNQIYHDPLFIEVKGKYEEDASKNAEILNAKYMQLLLRMIKWYNLEEIPSTFHKDHVFSQYICAISGKPIRRAVKAVHDLGKTLYERKELYHWKAQHPHELPNQWPEDIPFLPENMMSDKKSQKIIDERLEDCSNFFKIGLNTART
jgi:hypothetical protein